MSIPSSAHDLLTKVSGGSKELTQSTLDCDLETANEEDEEDKHKLEDLTVSKVGFHQSSELLIENRINSDNEL